MTDNFRGYRRAAKRFAKHETVNHMVQHRFERAGRLSGVRFRAVNDNNDSVDFHIQTGTAGAAGLESAGGRPAKGPAGFTFPFPEKYFILPLDIVLLLHYQ